MSQDWEIAPGQSLSVFEATSPYLVYDYPSSRSNPLLVVYSLQVQGQNPDLSWTRPPVTHNECMYYTITRCGDGVVDAGYETCDSGANNGTPGNCNATCSGDVPNNPEPVCNSSINGRTVSHPVTMGHCDVGVASNFRVSQNGITENYTWNCEAGARSVSCSANYAPYCGDGVRNV